MQITLTKEQEDWLRGEIAAGRFGSPEEAVAEAFEALKGEDDALSWAKPLVEEGLAELERGEVVSAEEVFARIEAGLRKKP